MRALGPALVFALALGLATADAPGAPPGDTEAAERQYRIARRLAAEGSSEAAGALRRVFELDPSGPRADDALIDQALLYELPRWPRDRAAPADGPARAAVALLEQALDAFPYRERAPEARYLRALLRLEPLALHDLSAARLDLVAVTAWHDGGSAWPGAARFALGWLDEQLGQDEAARAAYGRLLVDEPSSEAAGRARVALARLVLRSGEPGQAARLLQEAIEAGAPEESRASLLRELAVRVLLDERGAVSEPLPLLRVDTGLRSPALLEPTPDGGALVADRRDGRVVALDARGRALEEWNLGEVQALAADPWGVRFAAAGNTVFRLDAGGAAGAVASLGDWAPVSDLAADGLGGLWVLDRRGQSIARIDPGSTRPRSQLDERGLRLLALAWDGRRLLALDGRSKSVIAIGREGGTSVAVAAGLDRPVGLAADPAGRVAVLDARTGSVALFDFRGAPLAPWVVPADGRARPLALGLGVDGAVHVLDESGPWVRRP